MPSKLPSGRSFSGEWPPIPRSRARGCGESNTADQLDGDVVAEGEWGEIGPL